MVSLKMTPKEAKAEGYGAPAEVPVPEYPWGTVLTLTDEQVKALWPNGPPVKEAVLKLDAAAYVKGISVDDREGQPRRISVDLQVTDIAIETDGDKDLPNYYGKSGPRQSAA
jgi:hypothetical protein